MESQHGGAAQKLKGALYKLEGHILQGMEVYERETTEVVNRFLHHRLSFAECIAALDSALAGFIPRLTAEEITRLRIVMLATFRRKIGQPEPDR